MARMIVNVLVCLLFAVVASAQIVSFNLVSPSGATPYVGLNSDYYFVDLSPNQIPRGNAELTITEVDVGRGTDNLRFSTNTLSFSPSQRSVSFRVTASTPGTYSFTFTKTGDSDTDPAYGLAPAGGSVTFRIRDISIQTLAGFLYMGTPSEPLKISIPVASGSQISIRPSTTGLEGDFLANNSVTIVSANGDNNEIIIPAGSLSAAFTVIVKQAAVITSLTLDWIITGDDVAAGLYTSSITNAVLNLGTTLRPLNIYTYQTSSPQASSGIVGSTSSYLYVYTQQIANESFTLTPQAADTTFSPSEMTFVPDVNVARFQYSTASPGTKQINWQISGSGAVYYSNPASTTITIPKRTIYARVAASEMILGTKSYMSVYLSAPTPNRVIVDFFAANVQFPTPSVVFEKNITSFTVEIDPTNLGPDAISFKITNEDADWYNQVSDISINVNGGRFFAPSGWYMPALFVGAESPKIPIRASVPPKTSVTLTPSAPNVAFSPLSLTFKSGDKEDNIQQFFTATPLYTNSDQSSYTTQINWMVSGPDHAYFSAPAPMSISVNRRFIQTAWSAHLTNTDTTRNNPSAVHLGKTYKIWTTVNYIGEKDKVTVTPVSPYYSFSPKVMTFSEKKTRILLEATVTGVVGSTSIAYVIGGEAGGWYAPMSPDTRTTAIRPLAIEAAVVAPDNRTPRKKSPLVDTPDFSPSYLSSFHVYSFKLRSFVLPDGGLTITPKCAHATFSPSSIKLHGDDAEPIVDATVTPMPHLVRQNVTVEFNYTGLYLEANFSVKPQANGIHYVTFELSGKDAAYYDVPSDIPMMFRQIQRDSDEPKQASAGMVVPSIVAFAVAVVALLM